MSQTATTPLIDAPAGAAETAAPARPAIIDCDLHNEIDSLKDLYPYLPRRWHEHLDVFGVHTPNGGYYPRLHGPQRGCAAAVGASLGDGGGVHPPALPRPLQRRLRGAESGGAGELARAPGSS